MNRKYGTWFMAGALVVALAACAEEEDGLNAPGGSLNGTISWNLAQSLRSPHVGLAWMSMGTGEYPEFVTQAIPLTTGDFRIEGIQAPPSHAFEEVQMPDGPPLRVAFGGVLAFEDVDGNGEFAFEEDRLTAPDLMFGVSLLDGLLFLESAPSAEVAAYLFTNPEASRAGLLRVRADVCGGGYTILADDEPVQMFTFTPSDTFPEEIFEEAVNECSGEWPVEEEICPSELDAFFDCIDQHGDAACEEEEIALHDCYSSYLQDFYGEG